MTKRSSLENCLGYVNFDELEDDVYHRYFVKFISNLERWQNLIEGVKDNMNLDAPLLYHEHLKILHEFAESRDQLKWSPVHLADEASTCSFPGGDCMNINSKLLLESISRVRSEILSVVRALDPGVVRWTPETNSFVAKLLLLLEDIRHSKFDQFGTLYVMIDELEARISTDYRVLWRQIQRTRLHILGMEIAISRLDHDPVNIDAPTITRFEFLQFCMLANDRSLRSLEMLHRLEARLAHVRHLKTSMMTNQVILKQVPKALLTMLQDVVFVNIETMLHRFRERLFLRCRAAHMWITRMSRLHDVSIPILFKKLDLHSFRPSNITADYIVTTPYSSLDEKRHLMRSTEHDPYFECLYESEHVWAPTNTSKFSNTQTNLQLMDQQITKSDERIQKKSQYSNHDTSLDVVEFMGLERAVLCRMLLTLYMKRIQIQLERRGSLFENHPYDHYLDKVGYGIDIMQCYLRDRINLKTDIEIVQTLQGDSSLASLFSVCGHLERILETVCRVPEGMYTYLRMKTPAREIVEIETRKRFDMLTLDNGIELRRDMIPEGCDDWKECLLVAHSFWDANYQDMVSLGRILKFERARLTFEREFLSSESIAHSVRKMESETTLKYFRRKIQQPSDKREDEKHQHCNNIRCEDVKSKLSAILRESHNSWIPSLIEGNADQFEVLSPGKYFEEELLPKLRILFSDLEFPIAEDMSHMHRTRNCYTRRKITDTAFERIVDKFRKQFEELCKQYGI